MLKELQILKNSSWDYFDLLKSTDYRDVFIFRGAIEVYTLGDKAKVAVCFNTHEAFIICDDDGLYTKKDLIEGVFKNAKLLLDPCLDIDDCCRLAVIVRNKVKFDDVEVNLLKLPKKVTNDIAKRLKTLYDFVKTYKVAVDGDKIYLGTSKRLTKYTFKEREEININDEPNQRILNKVRGLFKLAYNGGDPEGNEASNAVYRAEKLMEEYGLKKKDINLKGIDVPKKVREKKV